MYPCLRPLVVWYRQVVAWDGARRTLSPESGTRVEVNKTRDATGPSEEEADVQVEDTDVLLATDSPDLLTLQPPELEEDFPEVIVAAARKGDLDVLKWFYTNGPKTSWKKAMKEAAVNRHWDIVEWIRLLRLHKCPVSVLTAAIRHGQYEIVTKLFDERELKHWPRRSDATELVQLLYSDQTSATRILKYITRCRKLRYRPRAKKHPFNHENVRTALHLRPSLAGFVFTGVSKLPGSLPTEIRQLISQFILPQPEELCSNVDAAKGGWVFWLLGFSTLENSHMVLAAEHGNLDGARQMHEHLARKAQLTCSRYRVMLSHWIVWGNQGWPLRCAGASQFLHPVDEKMLRFFRNHRDMRLRTCDLKWAVHRNDLDRVRLIRELDLVEDTASAAAIAAVSGNMKLLQVLYTGRVPVRYSTLAMDGASEEGHLSAVRYLHQRDAPCTQAALNRAAANGHFDVVCYLRVHGKPCSPAALYCACLNGHTPVVAYLAAQGV
ncbi:hypothetical protein Poli38472_010606 [Pythium oligandrum]|uniref:Uncharacterized protein n=1 Tax=Pythium oligandrum TaxID=41045 RepID=A0A8K1FCD6_PYTOL|nr:hypothetical protein Poli38472_010606 [Pythium oligandrum]|eukprot:TMW55724.1 hypothetical protein Poli38472_010606 [Pythium oligandrum]